MCGKGVQRRNVTCRGVMLCQPELKPRTKKICYLDPCPPEGPSYKVDNSAHKHQVHNDYNKVNQVYQPVAVVSSNTGAEIAVRETDTSVKETDKIVESSVETANSRDESGGSAKTNVDTAVETEQDRLFVKADNTFEGNPQNGQLGADGKADEVVPSGQISADVAPDLTNDNPKITDRNIQSELESSEKNSGEDPGVKALDPEQTLLHSEDVGQFKGGSSDKDTDPTKFKWVPLAWQSVSP